MENTTRNPTGCRSTRPANSRTWPHTLFGLGSRHGRSQPDSRSRRTGDGRACACQAARGPLCAGRVPRKMLSKRARMWDREGGTAGGRDWSSQTGVTRGKRGGIPTVAPGVFGLVVLYPPAYTSGTLTSNLLSAKHLRTAVFHSPRNHMGRATTAPQNRPCVTPRRRPEHDSPRPF